MNKKRQTLKYIVLDVLAAAIAWTLFFVYRKTYLEPLKFGYEIPISFDQNFFYGLILIPLFWVLIYFIIGAYNTIYRRSRLKEFGQTLLISVVGSLILFFVLILDDEIATYTHYYKSYIVIFTLHFTFTALFRLILTTHTGNRIKNRIIGFKTLIIGSNENALALYKEITNKKHSSGHHIIGFTHVEKRDEYLYRT